MTLSIKDPVADELARDVAKLKGLTLTEAVIESLRREKEYELRKKARHVENLVEIGMAIAHHCASLPVYDERSPDEILGYDENGLPN